jgi:hypothetical protein
MNEKREKSLAINKLKEGTKKENSSSNGKGKLIKQRDL